MLSLSSKVGKDPSCCGQIKTRSSSISQNAKVFGELFPRVKQLEIKNLEDKLDIFPLT